MGQNPFISLANPSPKTKRITKWKKKERRKPNHGSTKKGKELTKYRSKIKENYFFMIGDSLMKIEK